MTPKRGKDIRHARQPQDPVEIAILVRPFDMIKIAPNFFLVTKDEASKHNPWIRTTRSFGRYVTAAKKWQDTGGAFEDSQLRPWETISTTISLVTRTLIRFQKLSTQSETTPFVRHQ